MLLPLKPLMRLLYARVDGVIYLSLSLRDMLLAQGLPPNKMYLIRGAIDLTAFSDSDTDMEKVRGIVERLRCEWLGANVGLLIGCVGRLVAGKGQETLLEAMALLRGSGRRCRLVLIGDGPTRQSLESQAARLGIADAVCFTGFRDDIPHAIRALDILVAPSIHAELLPLAVMEGMAASRAVVAARNGGVPEIIVNDNCGCLVPPGDARALAAVLECLMDDGGLRRRLGQAGAQRIRDEFALPRMLDETIALYEQLICRSR